LGIFDNSEIYYLYSQSCTNRDDSILSNFSHGGKDIPIETARNYFVDKKGDVAIKGTAIQPEHRLFKIVPVNPAKK